MLTAQPLCDEGPFGDHTGCAGNPKPEILREAEEELADICAYDAARPKAQADLKAGNVVSLADYRTKRNARRK